MPIFFFDVTNFARADFREMFFVGFLGELKTPLKLEISSHFLALLENINFNHYLNDLRSETEFLSVSKKKL